MGLFGMGKMKGGGDTLFFCFAFTSELLRKVSKICLFGKEKNYKTKRILLKRGCTGKGES